MTHYQEHPHGSARFADPFEVRRAFRKKGGVPIGFHQGRMLSHSAQAGALLIGGAGCGKFTTKLAHIMGATGRKSGRKGEPPRYLILDPKGEMAAVMGPSLVHSRAHAYYINPYDLHDLPSHSLSLLSHLKSSSNTLVADARRTARTFLPESGGGDARFFEQKAQNWVDPLLRGLVHADGSVSPQSLYDLVCMIRAAPEAWEQMADAMAGMGEPDLHVTYTEMIEMAEDSRKTYDSVLSEIANALAFMNDANLQNTFTSNAGADFTLDVLTEDSDRPVFVFLMMPAELIAQNAVLIRQCFSTVRTLKQRKPHAPTINLVIDEAAQLGRFPEIAEFYAIGRGFGLSPFCVYQDIGQIKRNLGETGAMTLSASADVEIYLGGGISDLETAQHLSRKLGQQTIALDDGLTQERAARAKREVMHGTLFNGQDLTMFCDEGRQLCDLFDAHVFRHVRPFEPLMVMDCPLFRIFYW
ncbi:type IV secretory system conjugative DNA transfer family protein [Roseobacter sp. MH60115]|uniref:type IV secretory system conjugative DNA transfer family protein n=1 Tax=Roseobacter sp. MH60115 TaxID=2785324 RepID=UPI002DDA0116|nr:type IV secretory system conjugative DNA transfer family protein [Roseobacter sp. MH60115]